MSTKKLEFTTTWLPENADINGPRNDFLGPFKDGGYEVVLPVDVPFDQIKLLAGKKTKVTIELLQW